MTKSKLSIKQINDVSRAAKALEEEKIAFADFEFNMDLALFFNECRPFTEAYDKAIMSGIKAAQDGGVILKQDDVDKMLLKEHEITVPEITVEKLKKTGVALPISVLSTLMKYVVEEKKK